ncbi:DNA-binding proteins Bright/BRCAA1/RBP1 and proteins containing BRIGHT domain [Fusarium falciforme]|nr:DNA-binding proteins Bright/BRCAA1/RBP1 and proteins containing BRIGHT domain [Fusarium falciforme]
MPTTLPRSRRLVRRKDRIAFLSCCPRSHALTVDPLPQTRSFGSAYTQDRNPVIMATMAAASRDIPQASSSRDNLTAVAARSVPATVTRSQPLPTPPNSISPSLPPHGLKAQLQKAKLDPIDSDLDLHESSDHGRSVSPALEASGAITSSLLARYHLPEILLNHGPLAIRHIMGYLTTSVPGFSGIPPTKGETTGRGSVGRSGRRRRWTDWRGGI